jgi:translation initiation factor 3 subunit E
MLMRTLQSVFSDFTLAPSSLAPTYNDPIISFVLSLYVHNDLSKAATHLNEISAVADIDYFLTTCANELIASARLLFFEQYCRLHTRVEIAHLSKYIDLSQGIVVDKDNNVTLDTSSADGKSDLQEEKTEETPSSIHERAENACVSYIRACGVDARVGSLSGHLMIHSEFPHFYQQIVDKTRSLIYRSQSLRTSLQKRFAPRKEATEKGSREEDF